MGTYSSILQWNTHKGQQFDMNMSANASALARKQVWRRTAARHGCMKAKSSVSVKALHRASAHGDKGLNLTRSRSIQVSRGDLRLRGSLLKSHAVEESSSQGYVDGAEGAFTLAKISFGTILLYSGSALLSYGFGSYFEFLPGGSASALLLIYGFPASLLGFALKYAELKPVACRSTPEALAMRDTQATDIQRQIREDVTRFRYGDEQHLDEALIRIFRIGRYEGISRQMCPTLVGIREEVVDGAYALILEFK